MSSKILEKISLYDYEILAYMFAIRNPEVRELIGKALGNPAVDDLKKYGIDRRPLNSNYDFKSSLLSSDFTNEEKKLKAIYYDLLLTYGVNLCDVLNIKRTLFNPKEYTYRILGLYPDIEDDITAFNRIKVLIETRGRKLDKLMSNYDEYSSNPFYHYDQHTYEGKTIHAIDPTTNRKKKIKSDIEFIKEWINPTKYLQLLPQYK